MSGKVYVALAKCMSHSQSVCRTLLPHSHACFFAIFVSSCPRFPTYSRSCNGHAPLLIQKGRARAGQRVQPRRVGQNSTPDSSTALGKGKKCLAKCLSHSFFANDSSQSIQHDLFSLSQSFHFVASSPPSIASLFAPRNVYRLLLGGCQMKKWISICLACPSSIKSYVESYTDSKTCRRPLRKCLARWPASSNCLVIQHLHDRHHRAEMQVPI
jgi:hypothetical protein